MTHTLYRLTQRRYQATALSGTGSLHHNGRWHRAGIPVVYAAASPELALLEVLVHVERPRLLTMDWVVIPAHFDTELMETVDAYLPPDGLPPDWSSFPWSPATQQVGPSWYTAARSVVLQVPSAVIPSASNYLINPNHSRFKELTLALPQPFTIDPRLGS